MIVASRFLERRICTITKPTRQGLLKVWQTQICFLNLCALSRTLLSFFRDWCAHRRRVQPRHGRPRLHRDCLHRPGAREPRLDKEVLRGPRTGVLLCRSSDRPVLLGRRRLPPHLERRGFNLHDQGAQGARPQVRPLHIIWIPLHPRCNPRPCPRPRRNPPHAPHPIPFRLLLGWITRLPPKLVERTRLRLLGRAARDLPTRGDGVVPHARWLELCLRISLAGGSSSHRLAGECGTTHPSTPASSPQAPLLSHSSSSRSAVARNSAPRSATATTSPSRARRRMLRPNSRGCLRRRGVRREGV